MIVRHSFTEGTATSTASCEVAVASCAADDTIVVVWMFLDALTVSTLTCSGETVTQRGSLFTIPIDNMRVQWATLDDVQSSGTKTIQGTLSGTSTWQRMRAWRISGADLAAVMDATPVNATGNGTSATVNITTATANAAIFSFFAGNNLQPTGYESGFTSETVSNDFQYSGAQYDLDVGTAGSKAVGYTMNTGDWGTNCIAIKQFVLTATVPKMGRLIYLMP